MTTETAATLQSIEDTAKELRLDMLSGRVSEADAKSRMVAMLGLALEALGRELPKVS
jgi:hypothetical protein